MLEAALAMEWNTAGRTARMESWEVVMVHQGRSTGLARDGGKVERNGQIQDVIQTWSW